ncbi:MAG: DJ-1/PfpI family protein [Alphaproteobacteria bacterium]|nr:DJ-1/PfpI family protein [Alphaproteobacteria bacterium]
MTAANQPVAILVATGFEERNLTESQKIFLALGLDTKVISPDGGLAQGWHDDGWGHHFMADDNLAEILSADFSGLIVPAGERSAVTLKNNPHTSRLLKAFADAGKPMAVLGEAAALLDDAEIARTGSHDGDEAIIVDKALIVAAVGANIYVVLESFVKLLDGDDAKDADDEVERAA